MKVDGTAYRTIWIDDDGWSVRIIDQTKLPHRFTSVRLVTLEEAAWAIETMRVRGAPLIGATAAYGVALAMRKDPTAQSLDAAYDRLMGTRPTAINLKWALDQMRDHLRNRPHDVRPEEAYRKAATICDDDVATCEAIGRRGLTLFQEAWERKGSEDRLNVLTHCNAGWLATVDWGTALAPIYMAFNQGMPIHVWVDETRPRNQGAALTAWELGKHGVPHSIIVDNAGGHLMQTGDVDLCIVGTDRTAANGDVCNKIGTYLKALAARDNDVPFYVALPYSTIDWTVEKGADIPIEERDPEEVTHLSGATVGGDILTVNVAAPGSDAANYGFDVTPARLVTKLITERGVVDADRDALARMYRDP